MKPRTSERAAANALRRPVVLVLALLAVLAGVPPAAAQSSRPPRNPVDIQRKIEKSAELQRQALQTLANPGQAEQLIWKAYAELKSAHNDMILNLSNMKFPDPLLGVNSEKTDQALRLLQQAGDTLKARDQSSAPSGSVDVVRNHLEQALRLTGTVLATTF